MPYFHPILGLSVCLAESWIIKHIFTACGALWLGSDFKRKWGRVWNLASPAPGRQPGGIGGAVLFEAGVGE